MQSLPVWRCSLFWLMFFNGVAFLQALGDMVESIAGAVLLDTKLDLDKVWEIFKPLLSIATPANLELPPMRELLELLSHNGYFLNTKCMMEGEISVVCLSVQLMDDYLETSARDKNKKAAKGLAASLLLRKLQVCSFVCTVPLT